MLSKKMLAQLRRRINAGSRKTLPARVTHLLVDGKSAGFKTP